MKRHTLVFGQKLNHFNVHVRYVRLRAQAAFGGAINRLRSLDLITTFNNELVTTREGLSALHPLDMCALNDLEGIWTI